MKPLSEAVKGFDQAAYIQSMRQSANKQDDRLCKQECEICGGTGWVRYDRPREHPKFGKLEMCPGIDRLEMPQSIRFGLEKDEKAWDWTRVIDRENALQAAEVTKKVIEKGYGWVFLWGGVGLAKTIILKIAVAMWLRGGNDAAYTRMVSIIDHMRAAFDTEEPSTQAGMRLDWWADLPLLAIDEFDKLKATEYVSERRFLLMDRRYEQACRQKSITLIASNESPSRLPFYLSDRIEDGRFDIVHLTGESLRPAMDWVHD